MTVRESGETRLLSSRDLPEFRRMRRTLWSSVADHETDALLERLPNEYVVFVAPRPTGGLAAFAEVGTRNYAEGCKTSPVAYLEGIWVDPDVRRSQIAKRLVDHALAWAAEHGYEDLASDCELDNAISYLFHRAIGFAEVDRIICFHRKVPE